ncbi:MAG TPA: exodeoxyribonuclease VII small subunit [Anaerolineales bacterium]|jgi:exodeoxyribonuclease VII small subunit|nr:exodeoxyribonuclease VII small subunit [Anaerolineaceae bacterium]HJO33868.1 exodeoxyribonuclease VII small subunit [Anaerolineales bacterium]|tara:strand:- start:31 stop:246 length:216 start_codon:yes stop_codon:yes gene_type:complete
MGKQTKPESLSFEQALNELQSVVEQLEAGQLSLQDSLTLYKRGQQLSQRCNALLDAAETQIESEISPENED